MQCRQVADFASETCLPKRLNVRVGRLMAHKTHDAHVIVRPNRRPSGMAARDSDTSRIACQYREDLSGVPVDDPWTITTRIARREVSRPYPQIDIRMCRRTTRFEHDGPIDALTIPLR